MNHIFGDQVMLGLKYMKLLYENPMQILPIISLVSTERETGKTTFLNWISMLFGENSIVINPSDLTSDFNDSYATKNIIMIDETVIDKANTIEKLKSLATAKTISVNKKFVANYSVPFFGKIIICTNKENDFIRIDEEEIRFWIRKINPITTKKNVNIETDLFNEIPKFLRFLIDMPGVDLTRSRMVFTNEEICTQSLTLIKNESKSGLMKEIEIHLDEFFNNNDVTFFEATPTDMKNKWFSHNNNISAAYITKVLKDEFKILPQKMRSYYPFNDNLVTKKGTPYLFNIKESNFQLVKEENDLPF